MREAARTELDRVDELRVGQGMLEAYAFGRGSLSAGTVGGALDYSHRLSEGLSTFAHGELGYSYGDRAGLGFEALAGLRGRW